MLIAKLIIMVLAAASAAMARRGFRWYFAGLAAVNAPVSYAWVLGLILMGVGCWKMWQERAILS